MTTLPKSFQEIREQAHPQRVNLTGGKASKAIVITAGEDINPTTAIVTKENTEATVIFADDTEPIEVKLLGGVVYPYNIKKVTVGTDIVGLY